MNERLPDYYDPVVQALAKQIYQAYPSLTERYGDKGWKHTVEDNEHHFRHLEAAYTIGDKQVFTDYAIWLNGILTKHGMTTFLLIDNFERIPSVIQHQLGKEKETAFESYIEHAVEQLKITAEFEPNEKRPFNPS